MIEFTVAEWAAWAPGVETPEAWRAWARNPLPPTGEAMPALPEVPPMQRRRIERLGRMAVQVAYWCDPAGREAMPLVFASRHGDVQRSLELLRQQAQGEPMSPTQFGLSVHNAIAALYSIVRGQRGNYLALAAGKATAETALVDVVGLLADGAPEVLVVVYDTGLPAAYAGFADEPEARHAWCWRVRAGGEGARLLLDWQAGQEESEAGAAALPASLDVLRFLLSGDAVHVGHGDGVHWCWRRHD